MGIVFIYISIAPISIFSIRKLVRTQISRQPLHLGALLSHVPYPHNLESDPFRIFFGVLLNQYDDITRCVSVHSVPTPVGEPYEHTNLDPRARSSIATTNSVWSHLKPDLHVTFSDFRTYSHGLVSTLLPANYSRATMNVIGHIFIGILSRTSHITINRFFSTFVHHQQRAHTHAFPRSQTTPHIMSIY